MISFDDFKQLDIRIGTILSVEIVEGADKLLKLSVDLGEGEPRTIVSGIREYFPVRTDGSQENTTSNGAGSHVLVGKQVPVLTNLEPRVIRGIESEGMILAVGAESEFILLTPEKAVGVGALVK